MPELVFFRRGEEVLRVVLDRARMVLGRGDGCDVVIPDPEVSRRQLALLLPTVEGEGAVVAEDLSGRGTVIGGNTCARAELQDGTDIALGQWRAIFRERAQNASGGPDLDADAVTEVGNARTEVRAPEESPKALAARVRLRRGDVESSHPFRGDLMTIGQDSSNFLRLEDRFVSGKHLRVTRRGPMFRVQDLESTNGTFLGTVRLHDAEVPPGTTLRVGEAELTLEYLPNPGGAAPSPTAITDLNFEGILGRDSAIRALAELIDRVAPSAAAVAVFGESGTGKELVAQALHKRSSRASGHFIPVNCAAISKELIESELFGHEKGAFTGAVNARKGAFEEADGGTLFLDEIGELPLDLQAKLLRALESGEIKRVGAARPVRVDARIVTATHRDLLAMAKEGKFREDLYYRLCVVPLHLPPLRSRRGDVAMLVDHFLKIFAPRGQALKLTPAALERLQAHSWPGNVRELRNVIHRALLLRRGASIDVGDLTFDQSPQIPPSASGSADSATATMESQGPPVEYVAGLSLEQMLERLERQIVESALKKFNNNRERVARELGVARSTLFKRLKDWGLTRQDDSEGAPPVG